MKKILIVFGTRPEAIKLAPLIHEFKKNKKYFEIKTCTTGQHKQMVVDILDFFKIKPDFDLNIMKKRQSLNYISYNVIKKLDKIIESYKPNLILVHGDTNTSTIASLTAFYSNVKVGHIEAGLRTYNKKSPFPEEINRQITARIADFHFAPTKEAKNNLKKERLSSKNILITGNTVIDALVLAKKKLNHYTNKEIDFFKKNIKNNKKIILVTGHRRENLEKGLSVVCAALKDLIQKQKNIQIIYPVHLNPLVQKIVRNNLSNIKGIYLMNPLSYPSFLWLMKKSSLIITDSGGIQEEALFLKKPILVTRNTTERPEAIDNHFSFLVGLNKEKIVKQSMIVLNKKNKRYSKNIYGSGLASKKIINFLKNENRFL